MLEILSMTPSGNCLKSKLIPFWVHSRLNLPVPIWYRKKSMNHTWVVLPPGTRTMMVLVRTSGLDHCAGSKRPSDQQRRRCCMKRDERWLKELAQDGRREAFVKHAATYNSVLWPSHIKKPSNLMNGTLSGLLLVQSSWTAHPKTIQKHLKLHWIIERRVKCPFLKYWKVVGTGGKCGGHFWRTTGF